MPLNNPTAAVEANTGTYTGDAAANKSVAHGLTGKPKIVFITNLTNGSDFGVISTKKDGKIVRPNAGNLKTVTAMDSSNFYVGDGVSHQDSMNINARTYEFHAFK